MFVINYWEQVAEFVYKHRNLPDESEVRAFFQQAQNKLGAIHILVSNDPDLLNCFCTYTTSHRHSCSNHLMLLMLCKILLLITLKLRRD